MVDRFRAGVRRGDAGARAATQGLTTRQVVTLASLVEKETGKPDERPIVAAVYRNRLKIGMPMQADPTVVYALEKAHRYDGNIRRDDLALDSPYNTYSIRDCRPDRLPSPGKASLEAALLPADVPYLYFVSRNDGSHVFAEHARRAQRERAGSFRSNSSEPAGRLRRQAGQAALALAPLQLLAQQLEVAARGRLDEPQHLRRPS